MMISFFFFQFTFFFVSKIVLSFTCSRVVEFDG